MDELIKRLREVEEMLKVAQFKEAANLIEQAADSIEELSKPRWIPVAERLPEEEESVLVVRKFLGVKGQVPPSTYTEIAYRCGDRWIADSDEYKIARHRHTDPLYWMPLPAPPKEEK